MAPSSKRARIVVVKLVSTALTGAFYPVSRPRLAPKLAMMKFDKFVQRHVLFVEQKIKSR